MEATYSNADQDVPTALHYATVGELVLKYLAQTDRQVALDAMERRAVCPPWRKFIA